MVHHILHLTLANLSLFLSPHHPTCDTTAYLVSHYTIHHLILSLHSLLAYLTPSTPSSHALSSFNHWSTSAISIPPLPYSFFFFLNDPAPPEIYPFPLHAPLPI